MTEAGHNNPPSNIEFTQETFNALNDWLTDHPVIQTEEEAREAKLLLDRSRSCLKELEEELESKVRPLMEQVHSIRALYKEPGKLLGNIKAELAFRLNVFLKEEELRREQEARKAQEAAEEARRKAEEAEALAELAREEAAEGVIVDVGQASNAASEASKLADKAERQAARAEREQQHVKIGGGFRRALSLRQKETLLVTDPQAAIAVLGWTAEMMECIVKAARAYRKLHGNLPPGIESQTERSI